MMKRPSPLRNVMAKGTSVPPNKYDTKEFRSTLKESRPGDWRTPNGDIFVDGTYDPTTKVKQQSHVIKLDKGGVPFPGQSVGKKNAVQYPSRLRDIDENKSRNSLIDNQNGTIRYAQKSKKRTNLA